jgi:hypothetical protein
MVNIKLIKSAPTLSQFDLLLSHISPDKKVEVAKRGGRIFKLDSTRGKIAVKMSDLVNEYKELSAHESKLHPDYITKLNIRTVGKSLIRLEMEGELEVRKQSPLKRILTRILQFFSHPGRSNLQNILKIQAKYLQSPLSVEAQALKNELQTIPKRHKETQDHFYKLLNQSTKMSEKDRKNLLLQINATFLKLQKEDRQIADLQTRIDHITSQNPMMLYSILNEIAEKDYKAAIFLCTILIIPYESDYAVLVHAPKSFSLPVHTLIEQGNIMRLLGQL